jgi:hypothetical protein
VVPAVRTWRACLREFFGQALDLAQVMFAHRLPPAGSQAQAEPPLAIGALREFQAAHPQAHPAIVLDHALHPGPRGDPLPGRRWRLGRAAANLHARFEIAMVTRVHRQHRILFGIAEQLEAGGLAIETQQAKRGCALGARRDVENQAFHRDAALAATQIREPDQAERNQRGGIAPGRTGDRGPPLAPIAEQGAREDRRKAELQVGLGAQFSQPPARKLASEEQAEAFPKHQAPAAPPHLRAGMPRQIEQVDRAFPLGKTLHHQLQFAGRGRFDRGDVPRQVTAAVPGLQQQAARARFQKEVLRADGQQFFPGFEQRRLPRVADEGRNHPAHFFGAGSAARLVGWHRNPDYSVR